MTDELPTIEPGDLIGYHPVFGEDIRKVGIVRRFDGSNFIVSMPDDPGIEEKVHPDSIAAHRP